VPVDCWNRCYCKLGEWYEGLHGINETSIPQVIEYYSEATKHDKTWYKAWHLFAYLNYEAVLFYKQQRLTAGDAGAPASSSTNESAAASRSDESRAEVSRTCAFSYGVLSPGIYFLGTSVLNRSVLSHLLKHSYSDKYFISSDCALFHYFPIVYLFHVKPMSLLELCFTNF